MDRAADLWTLVSNLKNAAYDEQVHILQMLGDKLINDCRIEVFGVTIEPLWVLTYGISCRPLMPSAAKRLLSKTPLSIDKALVQELKISKEDIRLMKHYNMFVMV